MFEEVVRQIASLNYMDAYHLGFDLHDGRDRLLLHLAAGPDRSERILSFENVLFFQISRDPLSDQSCMLFEVLATPLEPMDGDWPPDLAMFPRRTSDLPWLLWIHTDGLVALDIVAAQVSMLGQLTV